MGTANIAIIAIMACIVCVILQVLLYQISFNFLLKKKLENCFEEIDSKKMILMSVLIIYIFNIPISFLLFFIYKSMEIVDPYGLFSLFLFLLPSIICFCILFGYFWKNLIIKNQEDKIVKAKIVSYLAFLPFDIIILFVIILGIF